MHTNNIRVITVIELNGLEANTITIVCKILNTKEDFDLETAMKAATQEYLHTENGKEVYEYNCKYFDYSDFVTYVPNDICRNHGFEMITTQADIIANWDEQLADEFEFDEFWENH